MMGEQVEAIRRKGVVLAPAISAHANRWSEGKQKKFENFENVDKCENFEQIWTNLKNLLNWI